MTSKVQGKVRGLSQFYVGGLERTEIWVNKKQADPLPFVEGKRVGIELLISSHRYHAGLRATSQNRYVWICPDLKDQNGARPSLAQVLKQFGFSKNLSVWLHVREKSVELTPTS